MNIKFIGTGSMISNDNQASYLVNNNIMVDFPQGTMKILKKNNLNEQIKYIFITHTHWDHIHGIPFFTPVYIKGNRFNFYSAFPDLKERIEYQQADSHFPIAFDNMQASKRFFTVPSN